MHQSLHLMFEVAELYQMEMEDVTDEVRIFTFSWSSLLTIVFFISLLFEDELYLWVVCTHVDLCVM